MKLDKFLSRHHFNFKLRLQCEAFHVKKISLKTSKGNITYNSINIVIIDLDIPYRLLL